MLKHVKSKLMLTYKNANNREYKNKADIKLYGEAFSWLSNFCEENDINHQTRQKLEFVLEEIYTNICSYAYPKEMGEIEMELNISKNNITLKFIDSGIPYNPLAKDDPDVELPIEEKSETRSVRESLFFHHPLRCIVSCETVSRSITRVLTR